MKRYISLFILSWGLSCGLCAQTIESVMRALQERHMALELRRYVEHKSAHYRPETQTFSSNYTPSVPVPISWGGSIAAYPIDGELAGYSIEDVVGILNVMRSRYNTFSGQFMTLNNSMGGNYNEQVGFDYRPIVLEYVHPVNINNYREALRRIGGGLNQLNGIAWPFRAKVSSFFTNDLLDADEDSPGTLPIGLNFDGDPDRDSWVGESDDGILFSLMPSDTEGQLGRFPLHPDSYRSKALLGTAQDMNTAMYECFTGMELGLFSGGRLIFLGTKLPIPDYMGGGVSVVGGAWPNGYEEFKGWRDVGQFLIQSESELYDLANYATGHLNGTLFFYKKQPSLNYYRYFVGSLLDDDHFQNSDAYPNFYNWAEVAVLRKFNFQHMVDLDVSPRTDRPLGVGDFYVDMRRQLICVNVGRGVQSSSIGILGISMPHSFRGSDVDYSKMGLAQAFKWRLLTEEPAFEVYYDASPEDLPVAASKITDTFFRYSMWGLLSIGEFMDWGAYNSPDGVFPDADWYRNPRIRQIVGEDAVVNVEVFGGSNAVDRSRFRLKIYRASQKGAFGSGVYSVTGIPVSEIDIEDLADEEGLRVSRIRGGNKNLKVYYEVPYVEPSHEDEDHYWIDYRNDVYFPAMDAYGLKIKKVVVEPLDSGFGPTIAEQYDEDGGVYSLAEDGIVIARAEYENGGEFYAPPFSSSAGLGAPVYAAQITEGGGTAVYKKGAGFSPTNMPFSYDGVNWFWQDFDTYGRVTKRIDQLGSNAFPTATEPWPDSSNHTTENTYVGNIQTTVNQRAGVVVGRSWRVWNGPTEVSDYVATDLSVTDYNDSRNLKTTTTYYAGDATTGGAEPWAIKAIVYPDQTASVYSYSYSPASKEKTVTVSTGIPDNASNPTSISAGTQTITVTNHQGYIISLVTKDIESNVVLSSEIAPSGQIDPFGRPTRIDYLDGTHIERTYYPDFRGLVQTETDRNGVVSTYTYDILNRLRTVVRDDVTTTITPTGLTTTTTFASSSGTRSESSTVNLFGELVSSSSGFEPATTTSVDHSGGRFTYTTTETVSGRTIIKRYFEDGTLESVSGTGTLPCKYEYGVESFAGPGPYAGKSLSYSKEILLTDGGTISDTYTKTYSDGTGRTVVVETPSGTGLGAAYSFSYYNPKGQLWKVIDPDGIVTLFDYDNRGKQVAVALDVNKNDAIDAGDQVASTVTTYAGGAATTVTKAGVGAGEREVRRTSTTIASGVTTITRNGNNDLARTFTPDIQAKSVTVSGADGSVIYEYDDNGRPKTYTVKDASATTLQSASYNHDKFGRLQQTTRSAAGASYVTTFNPDGTLSASTATGTGVATQAFSVSYTHPNGNQRVEITNTTAGKSQTLEFKGTGELIERSGFGTFDITLNHTRDSGGVTTTLETDGGAVTTFTANAAGAQSGKTFTGGLAGPAVTYSAGGLPEALTTPANADATYGYGTAGVERGSVKTITYPANTNTANIAIDYDEFGRVETIADASGTRTLAYVNDQLDTETYTAGPLSGLVIDRSFDARERRAGLSITRGAQTLYNVGYGYHGNTSSLARVTLGDFSAHYTYEPGTQLIADVVQKRGATPVLSTDRSYDSYKRLQSIATAAGANTTTYTYRYNTAGQRDRITRENGDYWDLGYQADGQLHTAVKKAAGGQAYPGYSYAYDFTAIGNRSTVAINDTPAVDREADYDANALNQVTSREVPGFVDVLGSVHPLSNVTVDVRNQASPVAKKGTWTASTAGGGFNGTGYLHDGNANKGASWVDYSLVVAPGTYAVELMWSASPGNSSAVPVIVIANGVRKTRVVNQQANGGVWVETGSYALADGGRLSVRIANMGTAGQVVADAVRIKRTTDTWMQILDSEDAEIVTTLTAAKLGDIFHLAIPVDNSAGPVAAEFEITGTLAGAGENGADAVAAFQTSAIIAPAGTALDHDADGRRKDDWKWIYTWNAAGQLRSVESTTAYVNVGGPQLKLVFDYDAQGRRFSKKVYRNGSSAPSETLYFVYDGWNLIAELDESLSVVRSYTWGLDISQGYQGAGGIGGLLSIHLASGATYFPIYDGAGNITGLVNAATDAVEAVYEYAPFGELVRMSGPAASVSPFGFSTKYTDKETGFCYYGHRYYDPELGHWISREPLGEMESANLYAFCKNDPINYVDYLGLEGIFSAAFSNGSLASFDATALPTPAEKLSESLHLEVMGIVQAQLFAENRLWTNPATGRDEMVAPWMFTSFPNDPAVRYLNTRDFAVDYGPDIVLAVMSGGEGNLIKAGLGPLVRGSARLAARELSELSLRRSLAIARREASVLALPEARLLLNEFPGIFNIGVNITPKSTAMKFRTIMSPSVGRTFVTEVNAVERIIGPLHGSKIKITSAQARQLEAALGLKPNSLESQNIISIIENIHERAPASPIGGNSFFLGGGIGLPGGGAELTIPSIPSAGGFGIKQIILEVL